MCMIPKSVYKKNVGKAIIVLEVGIKRHNPGPVSHPKQKINLSAALVGRIGMDAKCRTEAVFGL